VATGSMVSPRLLLTNNHVLGSRDEAARSVVKFDYQLGENGVALAASTFALRPDEFFATDETLDYTLVAVATTAKEGTPLAHFGWNRLIGTEGKILKGYPVNIIQHPEGGYKQIVLSGNQVLELSKDDFLYDADTLPGSSGAPVFNREWEIVALHRRSVPHLVDGKIVTRGGQAWTPDIPDSEILWIGNLGTRVSSLVRHIASLPLEGEQVSLRRELIETEPPNPFLVSQQALGGRPGADRAVAAAGDVDHAGKAGIAGNSGHGNRTMQISVPLELRIEIASVTLALPDRRA
jgi:endonuclease G